jgi:SagB-type dehydrogenase family enzyme
MAEQNNAFADRIDAAEAGEDLETPGPYKDYPDAPFTELPKSRVQIDAASVGTALYKRRTCRKFGNRVIELPRFAELVQHCFSANEWPLGRMGMHLRRTTPSGGGRHPVEVYAVVRHVDGIAPGLYHYSVRRHGLEQLKAGDFGDTVFHLGHKQSGLENFSAAFFYTARWDRHVWKYRYARSYRMVMFDIAHLVQTTLVAATALDLRSFLTPALRDTEAAQFLGVDDLEESPIYVTSIG